MKARRIVVSLTPLLDLLLIVIFAQYMDLKGKSDEAVAKLLQNEAAEAARQQRMEAADAAATHAARAAQDAAAARKQAERLRAAAAAERDAAVRLRKQVEAELQAKIKTIADLRADVDRLKLELKVVRTDAAEEVEQAHRDLELAAGALADILKLPPEAFTDALETLPEDERMAVRRELEDVRGKGVEKVIQHLRKISALKKRCDFWEVYIAADDSVTVKSNAQVYGPFSAESEDQFILEMKQITERLPEPKSLVIILLSWGDAQRQTRRTAEESLRTLANVYLKSKHGGQKRFELAVLGFSASPP